jgi:hypothetical protein
MMKFGEIAFLEMPTRLIGWMSDAWNGDSKIVALVAFFCLVLVAGAIALHFIRWVLDTAAAIVTSLAKLGLRLIGSTERKFAYRRRQQFCGALRSDLDSMAKLENWNDQWFTDLEAEVEANGQYYSGQFNRIIGRSSNGVRRVASLMQAINTSAEERMVLVGEPGSGKSIALRHLARQLADIGTSLRGEKLQIPLYINLKELPACEPSELNADFIEDFVKDHVRRGDSDTAEYLRDHWQDFKSRGIWFFLFDSFDEIPAILHAPNGSPTVSAHSNAVRQFMDGMGSCKGVLASREYKGPEALPWKQLRILTLDAKHKDELIENTSLDSEQKNQVRRHLSGTENAIFGNPLFLSLLCRHIKKIGEAPTNDLDLLGSHIRSLAERDPKYLLEKYGFSPADLLTGATGLAVLFAERPELSLAPRYDEIALVSAESKWVQPEKLEPLLSALIDFKIGRSDVKEARLGDRRFSFAHRRYQETLFVEHLAKNPDHISHTELLLDSRWREFAVTLLQSQPASIVRMFTSEATLLITRLELPLIPISSELGSNFYYSEWAAQPLLHLLKLLNEGLARRLDDVPDALRAAIADQLIPRWLKGDLVDKLMILRHGCLLPAAQYQEILEWGMLSKIEVVQEACFKNAQYLGSTERKLNGWIRLRLADEVIAADNRIELHKLDALSHRLPRDLGAPVIFARCKKLWSLTYSLLPVRATLAMINFQIAYIDRSLGQNFLRVKSASQASLLTTLVFYWVPIFFIATVAAISEASSHILSTLLVLLTVGTATLWTSMVLRAEPERLSINYLFKYLARGKGLLKKELLIPVLAVGVFGGVFVATVATLVQILGVDFTGIAFIAFMISLMVMLQIMRIKRVRSAKNRLAAYLKDNPNAFQLVRNARTFEELTLWLNGRANMLFDRPEVVRSILCYLSDSEKNNAKPDRFSRSSLRKLESELLNKLQLIS